jgi:Fe-S-cluster-containing dehydrogenase component
MGCHACEVACKQEHRLGVGPRLAPVLEQSPDYIPNISNTYLCISVASATNEA